jgi:two-component system chemotaxis response regulator CheY
MLVSHHPIGTSTAQDLSGVCILVLDDDPNMRSLIRGVLARCGCQNVLMRGDARDALQLFSTRTIDLVICDWMMEPMSGLDFLRELRRPERALNVPVLMVTANSEPGDVALARQYKISGWLVKPITLPQLAERVSAVLTLSAKALATDTDYAAEVARLADQYRAKLVNDLRDLDDALASMQRSKINPGANWTIAAERESTWALVGRIMHNIKGQAGSFDYGLVTSVAALGQDLVRGLTRNTQLVFHHHDEVHRCIVALVQAMRLILQNEIRGDGGQVGERLVAKLLAYTQQVRAKLDAGTDAH